MCVAEKETAGAATVRERTHLQGPPACCTVEAAVAVAAWQAPVGGQCVAGAAELLLQQGCAAGGAPACCLAQAVPVVGGVGVAVVARPAACGQQQQATRGRCKQSHIV